MAATYCIDCRVVLLYSLVRVNSNEDATVSRAYLTQ
jgi:hypothetical protein